MQGKTQTSACSPLTSQDAPSPCTAKLFQAEPPVCLTDRCPRGHNPPTHIHTGGTSPNLQVDLLKCLPNQSACLAAHSPALEEATPLLPWRSRSLQPRPPLPLSGPRAFQGIYKILSLFCSVCAQLLSRVQLFVTPATQSCLTLCDPTDRSSSVHGIFQARILEQVAISYSKGSSPPRD